MEIVLHGSSDCPARHPAPPAGPALARYLYNPPPRYFYQTTMVNGMAGNTPGDRDFVVVHGK